MRASQLFPACRERHRKPDKDVKDEKISFVAEAKYLSPDSQNITRWVSVANNDTFEALKEKTLRSSVTGNYLPVVRRIESNEPEVGMVLLHEHESPTGEIYVRLIAQAAYYGVRGSDMRALNICHAGEDAPMLDISADSEKPQYGPIFTTYTVSWVASDLSIVTLKTRELAWRQGESPALNYGDYDLKLFIPASGRARLESKHVKSGKVFVDYAPEGHAPGINDKAGPKEIRILHRKGETSKGYDMAIGRIGIGNKISGALP